jgi:hypothetical protein
MFMLDAAETTRRFLDVDGIGSAQSGHVIS